MKGIVSDSTVIWITLIFVAIELITLYGIRYIIKKNRSKRIFFAIYWFSTLIVLSIWLISYGQVEKIRQIQNYNFFYFSSVLLTLNYLPKLIFSIFVLFAYVILLLGFKSKIPIVISGGLILWLGLSLSILYGVISGRKMLTVENVTISITSLPTELDGLKIVQISDAHLASFRENKFLERCVKKVNCTEPDLFFFTGDIVNNYYSEMIGFEDQLKAFNAKYGKYAILGNHDYGNYINWKEPDDKLHNNNKIKEILVDAGFNLLVNESDKLEINNTVLYVIGTEDWGHGEYHKYSNLDKAIKYTDNESFKILIAHNPKQWREQILSETNIPLTLSGHTHGGQAGFKIAGLRFSIMRLIEKNWGGLYHDNDQFLYVNRGLGCVGDLVRVDMEPEITVITLKRVY